MNPEALLESTCLRQDLCNEANTSVLDSVGQLVMLPNAGFATTEQVAQFYGVKVKVVQNVVNRHENEFKVYGYKILQKKEITGPHNEGLLSLFKSRSKSIAIFPRPAILLCGCLLRDSEVAKMVRQYLISAEQTLSPSVRKEILQVVDERISQQVACINQKIDAFMLEIREEASNLKHWTTGLEQVVSDWDNFFQQLAFNPKEICVSDTKNSHSPENTITPGQAAVLKEKVHETGNTQNVWKDFKRRFSIHKYSLLPANKWEDAMQWLKDYASLSCFFCKENHATDSLSCCRVIRWH